MSMQNAIAPQPPKLLVVDDQAICIDLLFAAFSADYQLIAATSGEMALALCATDRPDMVLLDVSMGGGMDGFAVCSRLKADPCLRDIPVIFVTGQADSESETRGLEVGAVDFIAKPVNIKVARARVKAHFTIHAQAAQLRASEQEQRYLAQELELRAARFHLLVAGLHVGVLVQSPRSEITLVNARACELLGLTEDQLLGKTSFDPRWNVIHEDGSDFPGPTHPVPLVIASKKPVRNVVMGVYRPILGDRLWLLVNAEPQLDSNGALVEVICTFSDITEQVRAQERLRNGETRFRAIIESMPVPMALNDDAGNITFVNDAFVQTYGYTQAEVSTLEAWWPLAYPDPDYRAWVAKLWLQELETAKRENRGFTSFEVNLRAKDGSVHTVSAGAAAFDPERMDEHVVVLHDITAIKAIQTALEATVAEKNSLLKEVHHRVKNNLQIITSLLRLESRRSTHAETTTVLGEMQARIRAMALLHESLYRSGTLASIDLGHYLQQLSTQAFRTQSMDPAAVALQLHLGTVQIGMDQAIPCGLLVNELISNCLKHGFPTGSTGQVSIDLRPLALQQQWCLRVCDNGVGLPHDFEDRRERSLGLQLAADLARQIGGALDISPNVDKGVAFTVEFKVLEPAPLIMPL